MAYTAYRTIAEFMNEWHDTISGLKLNTLCFTGQKALVLTADHTAYTRYEYSTSLDVAIECGYEYSTSLDAAIECGARSCNLLSNGSMMPGAILVDIANKQTTFFRLNPNDAKYKELEKAGR
jgi:hypothetical protein